jgi:hypothetical protein
VTFTNVSIIPLSPHAPRNRHELEVITEDASLARILQTSVKPGRPLYPANRAVYETLEYLAGIWSFSSALAFFAPISLKNVVMTAQRLIIAYFLRGLEFQPNLVINLNLKM